MKVIVTNSVPSSKREAARETVAGMLAACLARHPHYTHMLAVVGLAAGGRGWSVQLLPLDPALVWDEPFAMGVGSELLDAVCEALRLL